MKSKNNPSIPLQKILPIQTTAGHGSIAVYVSLVEFASGRERFFIYEDFSYMRIQQTLLCVGRGFPTSIVSDGAIPTTLSASHISHHLYTFIY